MKTLFFKPWLPRDLKRRARENAARGKLLNIMNDTVFKDVFTDDTEDSREALRLLLSACTHRDISKVKVLNNEMLPEHLTGKTVRLDVHVTFNDGEQADLEMQMERSGDDLKKRASLYAARLLSGQAKKGESYAGIKRVYQIFFLNTILFPGSKKFPRRYFLMEETEHDRLNEIMEVIFYELPKLEQKAKACFAGEGALENLPEEEKWCIYMKYRHEEKAAGLVEELCREEEGIMRTERALAKVSRDYETWARTLFREKAEMDYRSGMFTARKEGEAAGEVKGYERARQEYEGRLEGIAQDKQLEIARKLKSRGLPLPEIAGDTGLPLEAVEKL